MFTAYDYYQAQRPSRDQPKELSVDFVQADEPVEDVAPGEDVAADEPVPDENVAADEPVPDEDVAANEPASANKNGAADEPVPVAAGVAMRASFVDAC